MTRPIDYARLGKHHARKALKEFFLKAPELHKQDCEHDDSICDDCLVQHAFDTFYNVQLKDAMDTTNKFMYPPNQEAEKAYNDAALDMITNSVKNMPRHGGGSPDHITHPEEAYAIGKETMSDALNEVFRFMTPEDYHSSNLKEQLAERTWKLLETKAEEGSLTIPHIHGVLRSYYDRGMHDALSKMEVPALPPASASIFRTPKRAARYEKLLMDVHN